MPQQEFEREFIVSGSFHISVVESSVVSLTQQPIPSYSSRFQVKGIKGLPLVKGSRLLYGFWFKGLFLMAKGYRLKVMG